MIVLHQFPAPPALPNYSPFCMKVETYLRMTALPYRVKSTLPSKAPKKKLPYITDDGATVADSVLIIEYLKKKYGDPLDAGLSDAQRAQMQALRCLLEEHLYFCALHDRWVVEANFPVVRDAFLGFMPRLMRKFVGNMVRKTMRKTSYRQGIGRHSDAEIYAFGIADLAALTELLADKPYFFGNEPASIDASAYAMLVNLLWGPVDSPLTRYAGSQPTLVAYCERIKKRYYA
jgi:glutathione S-transferase